MSTGGDYFEEPKTPPAIGTVDEIRDRLIASGVPCKTERLGNEVRITFPNRKCYLLFTVNASGRPLTASMPDATDYDAEFAHALFQVFDSIGWKFQP